MYFIYIVESFKERNQKIKIENQKLISKKNSDQLNRHANNLLKLNEENEKIVKINEQRDFKKYIAFFWQRKLKEKENKKRKKEHSHKLQEKAEKLKEIEILNEKKRDELLKRIKSMDLRKELLEKKKMLKYQKIKN